MKGYTKGGGTVSSCLGVGYYFSQAVIKKRLQGEAGVREGVGCHDDSCKGYLGFAEAEEEDLNAVIRYKPSNPGRSGEHGGFGTERMTVFVLQNYANT
eukprot:746839-Hanusia_phi.AAC.6